MKIIKTKVIGDTITPIEQGYVIENQVNQYAIEFDFDETWNFQEKYCIFQDEFEEQTFKRPILANQVIVPSELLNGRITIQVYGQNIENDVITNRQPSLKYVFSILNSLPTNASEEEDTPTPTQWELYIEQIENIVDDMCEKFQEVKSQVELNTEDIGKAQQDIEDLQDRATTDEGLIQENATEISNIKRDYSLITETGNKLSVSIDSNYLMTITLKDKNNNILSTASVDFPIESAIVNATYNNTTKEITFTLQNGNTLVVPIGDIISGLASQSDLQELANRVQTIENDYLTSADKTELQESITGLGNEIELEQQAQDNNILALQQENERLSRIVEGLPTKQANGTSFVLNDMVKANIKDYQLRGNTIQNGTPTPDSPIAIQTATGNQIINVCGKNILNISSISSFNGITNTINQDGTITSSGLPNSSWQVYATIELDDYIDNGKTYTISQTQASRKMYLQVNEISKSDSSVHQRYYLTANQSTSFVANKDLYTYKAYIQNGDTSYWESTSQTITQYYQIELNNSATSYEKFIQRSKTISLGTIELNKIGNYQDRIYKSNDKWYLEKNIGKYIIDENTPIESSGVSSGFNTMRVLMTNILSNNKAISSSANVLSNMFVGNVMWSRDEEGIYVDQNNAVYRINTSIIGGSTRENLISWLSTHNIILYYILATPTTTEITDSSLISQLEDILNIILNENNTIIINGNLPSDTLVISYADISKLIASLSSQDNRSVEENTRKVEEPIEEPIETKEEER